MFKFYTSLRVYDTFRKVDNYSKETLCVLSVLDIFCVPSTHKLIVLWYKMMRVHKCMTPYTTNRLTCLNYS